MTKCKVFKLTNGGWVTIYPYPFYTDLNRHPNKSVVNDTWQNAMNAAEWFRKTFGEAVVQHELG